MTKIEKPIIKILNKEGVVIKEFTPSDDEHTFTYPHNYMDRKTIDNMHTISCNGTANDYILAHFGNIPHMMGDKADTIYIGETAKFILINI
jgi:hypothetical protein